jgi:hypothetical protein
VKRVLIVVLLLLSSIERTSRAADDLPDVGRAQLAFQRGLVQVSKNDLESARRSFASAYALVPSVDILWNLAMTERKLGKNVDALHHFRAYVGDATARADRKAIAQAEILPELTDLTAHITVKALEGAVVTIDGAPMLSSTTDVEPGIHSVAIANANGGFARAIDAGAGSTIHVDLTPPPPAPAPAPTPTPIASPKVIMSTSSTSTSTSTTTTSSSSSSRESPAARTWTVATMGGASVVLLAGGIAFASLASMDRGRAERLYTQMQNDNLSCTQSGTICEDHDSASSAADREGAAATTMFVLSGVLAGASIATWLLWPMTKSRASIAFTKDGASVAMTGRF